MKNLKYIGLFLLSLGITSCDVNNELDEIPAEMIEEVPLNTNGLDFSSYVSIGASFTAGFTDNALFIAAQQNSFPNILASKFQTTFNQPLMNDNIGGLLFQGNVIQGPRLFFNGSGPQTLPATPTTEVTTKVSGSLNNFGIPGAKSFHFVATGYGNTAGVPLGLANPYFARISSSASATVLGDAMAQNPTFFTLSEVGGNDVLGFALSGGFNPPNSANPMGYNAILQNDPTVSPADYGPNDITNPLVFGSIFEGMVNTLTSGGARGVVGNVPYITNLAHFTTVPFNPLDPSNPNLAAQIPLLNTVFGALNQIFVAINQPNRVIEFSTETSNALVIRDESLADISATITGALNANPTFPAFVQQFGLPAQAAPLVAQLLGNTYGQARQATEADLFVLPSSSIIATVNQTNMQNLMNQGLPATLAAQFSAEGVTLPLADRWVLTPDEQASIRTATDAYNATISAVASANPNIALVDLKAILEEASTGITFDRYTLTTNLVVGGLISLDGVHLTARGYALMANSILAAMDAEFGSNFTQATGGLAVAGEYPTNYSPMLR